ASPSAAVFVGVMDRITTDDEGSGREQGARGAHLEQPGEGAAADRPYLDRVVTLILQGQISKQEAYLHFLATAGNITPFIGLFGTVIGIINAFHEIGKQGTANIAAVAPGVAEALVATAAGLFAAIPAVIAYNYYLTRIRRTAFRVESFSLEFLNSLDSWVNRWVCARDLRKSTSPVSGRDQRDPVGGCGARPAGDLHGNGTDAVPWNGHQASHLHE